MNVTTPRNGNPSSDARQLTEAAREAATQVGVRLFNLRVTSNARNFGIAFTLKTGDKIERRKDWRGKYKFMPKYQRYTTCERQSSAKGHEGESFYPVVPGAVCWHGHRDFLRAFYALIPNAKIKTAFITYTGARDFEARYRTTYDGAPKDTGGFATYARPYKDACSCEE